VVGFISPDMVAAGVVRNFARPGGNITGVSIVPELDGKRQRRFGKSVTTGNAVSVAGK
jgi:ABC-type uncharacterized transport system substrate-binding protein